jgi:hypothetical protein
MGRLIGIVPLFIACATAQAAGAPAQGECEFIANLIDAAGTSFSSLKGTKDYDSSMGWEVWHSKLIAPGASYCDVKQKTDRAEFVCYWYYGASLSETELEQRAKATTQEFRVCIEESALAGRAWIQTASEDNGNNPPLYVLDRDHNLVIEISTNSDKAYGRDDNSDVYMSVEWFMKAEEWPHELEEMKKLKLPMIPLARGSK